MSRNSGNYQRENYMGNPNLPTVNVKQEYTEEQLLEFQKCMDDVTYFAEKFFYIVNLDRGKETIKLYKPQKRILKTLVNNRFTLVCASRQTGKSTIMTIYALWITCFMPDKRILIVANKEDTSIVILRRIRMAYELLPNWLKPGVKQWGTTEVIFGNDSSIAVSTTTGSAGRGESASVVVIDEMAHVQSHLLEPFWKSVVPIISSAQSTKLIAISTPNGQDNKFYEIYAGVKSGKLKDWVVEEIRWNDIPRKPTANIWKRQIMETLGGDEAAFAQEFDLHFAEEGKTAIDTDTIERLKSKVKDPQITLDDGCYKIWHPPEPKKIYSMGCDVSEGVEGNASTIQIFDITDLSNIIQCATYKNHKIDPAVFANKIHDIAQQWGLPTIAVERNGPGAETIGTLYNVHRYDGIVTVLPDGQKKYDKMGIYSHTSLKYKAIINMRYWINNLKAVKINDLQTIQELETFVQSSSNTFKKKSGTDVYDDLVMAMVWSLFVLEPSVTPSYYEVLEYDKQGKPLRITHNDVSKFDNFNPQLAQVVSSDRDYIGAQPLGMYFGHDDGIFDGFPDEEVSADELMRRGWTAIKNKQYK